MLRKRTLVLLLLVGAAVILVASTQVWATFSLAPGAATVTEVAVTGQQTTPALMPIAIALIAAAVTLSIAGKVLRPILAIVTALLGGGIAVVCIGRVFGSSADLVASAGAALSEVTGLGASDHTGIVVEAHQSVWPAIAAGAGLCVAIIAVIVCVVGRSWTTGGRRYESAAPRTAAGGRTDRISDWDAISEGDDPSDDPAESGGEPDPGPGAGDPKR